MFLSNRRPAPVRERITNRRVAPVLLGVIGKGLKALDFPRIRSQRLATRNWQRERSRYCEKPFVWGLSFGALGEIRIAVLTIAYLEFFAQFWSEGQVEGQDGGRLEVAWSVKI